MLSCSALSSARKVVSIDIGVNNMAISEWLLNTSESTTAQATSCLCKQPSILSSDTQLEQSLDNSFSAKVSLELKDFALYNCERAEISRGTPTKKLELVLNRCSNIVWLLDQISPDVILCEKQFPTNVKAMNLMYAISTYATVHNLEMKIIDPKEKFKFWNIPINTKNKAHKKESVRRCEEYLSHSSEMDYVLSEKPEGCTECYALPKRLLQKFENLSKKDDVADSINQCLAHFALLLA